jgi:hypothetical protein
MTQTLSAIYDGEVLKLESPLAFQIKPNTRVKVTIEEMASNEPATVSFFNVALSLNLQGPSDWSSRVDDYLYGDAWNELDQKGSNAEDGKTDVS